jgi:hypothetical protein
MPVIPALRQEGYEFEASLGYTVISYDKLKRMKRKGYDFFFAFPHRSPKMSQVSQESSILSGEAWRALAVRTLITKPLQDSEAF